MLIRTALATAILLSITQVYGQTPKTKPQAGVQKARKDLTEVVWGKVVSTETGLVELNVGFKDGLRKGDTIYLYPATKGSKAIDSDRVVSVGDRNAFTLFKPHAAKVGDTVAFRRVLKREEPPEDRKQRLRSWQAKQDLVSRSHVVEVVNMTDFDLTVSLSHATGFLPDGTLNFDIIDDQIPPGRFTHFSGNRFGRVLRYLLIIDVTPDMTVESRTFETTIEPGKRFHRIIVGYSSFSEPESETLRAIGEAKREAREQRRLAYLREREGRRSGSERLSEGLRLLGGVAVAGAGLAYGLSQTDAGQNLLEAAGSQSGEPSRSTSGPPRGKDTRSSSQEQAESNTVTLTFEITRGGKAVGDLPIKVHHVSLPVSLALGSLADDTKYTDRSGRITVVAGKGQHLYVSVKGGRLLWDGSSRTDDTIQLSVP